ncbi:hypothetical protein FB451DRAFT_1171670 [Mycena latifolia]|nr:hypothetical protein FB451DRAFT_1171670 [Mycena latifolia]
MYFRLSPEYFGDFMRGKSTTMGPVADNVADNNPAQPAVNPTVYGSVELLLIDKQRGRRKSPRTEIHYFRDQMASSSDVSSEFAQNQLKWQLNLTKWAYRPTGTPRLEYKWFQYSDTEDFSPKTRVDQGQIDPILPALFTL